ncbi:hypothetical protein ElyMa_003106300 [Elysia marginata]|uniref:Uncharacterized protein n=1 Tax=Elysia marginata TaxID=1093978 RepID=A0AAV4ITA3_9GAST|nr:hypothetical protein ElyMa_003106300 [Elysia marginata]
MRQTELNQSQNFIKETTQMVSFRDGVEIFLFYEEMRETADLTVVCEKVADMVEIWRSETPGRQNSCVMRRERRNEGYNAIL